VAFRAQRFTLRVKHDAGFVTIRAVASSAEDARSLVCIAERCPDCAIKRVWPGKVIYETPT
jgi:hypothetical protein